MAMCATTATMAMAANAAIHRQELLALCTGQIMGFVQECLGSWGEPRYNGSMKRALVMLSALAAASAMAQVSLIWRNVANYPSDLANSIDAWSATRSDDGDSLRCAAEDFTVSRPVRITRIVYYGVPINGPIILGGDWYLYAESGGEPGALIAAGSGQVLDVQDTGIYNPAFGTTVRRHTMRPTNLMLRPGRYFMAFRTLQSFRDGAGKNGAISTRVALGSTRALWNFGVQPDGTVTSGWTPLSTFNLFPDNEWAFELWGLGPSATP